MRTTIKCENGYDAERVRKKLRGAYPAGSDGLTVEAEVDAARIVKKLHLWRVTRASRLGEMVDDVSEIADMLRYDAAFFNPARPGMVATFTYAAPGRGTFRGDRPTVGRWSSFLLRIVDWTGERPLLEDVIREADQWVTYRHNNDYRQLIETTLREWVGRVAADVR